jgi:hypothetical protein
MMLTRRHPVQFFPAGSETHLPAAVHESETSVPEGGLKFAPFAGVAAAALRASSAAAAAQRRAPYDHGVRRPASSPVAPPRPLSSHASTKLRELCALNESAPTVCWEGVFHSTYSLHPVRRARFGSCRCPPSHDRESNRRGRLINSAAGRVIS